MPQVITLTTNGTLDHTLAVLKRTRHKIPQGTREGMRKWGKSLQQEVRKAAMNAPNYKGIAMQSSGKLINNGIRWEQGKKSNRGALFIYQYGVFVDSMKPHWVTLRSRRTRLMRWAQNAWNPRIRAKAMRVQRNTGTRVQGDEPGKSGFQAKNESIYVTPHPFIRRGYKMAKPKLPIMLKQEVSRATRTSAR